MPVARQRGVVLDVYGAFARHLDPEGWLAIADLIQLLREAGVDEQAVRSSISRMKQKGLLVPSRRARGVGYSPSAELLDVLRAGDRRIFATAQPARLDDGWVVAVFSVPESDRHRRHLLRARLSWLGLGILAPGVWLGPRRLCTDVEAAVRSLHLAGCVALFEATYYGFDELAALVPRCWDLPGLARLYDEFLADHGPVRERWAHQPGDDAQAFADYLRALSQWRRLPYLDPGLPAQLLPEDWAGHRAAAVFHDLHATLHSGACRFARSVTTDTRACLVRTPASR